MSRCVQTLDWYFIYLPQKYEVLEMMQTITLMEATIYLQY